MRAPSASTLTSAKPLTCCLLNGSISTTVTRGRVFSTYVIVGNKGEVCLNGAAARLVQPGDIVIIASYAEFEEEEAKVHQPKLVYLNAQNAVTHTGNDIPPKLVL